MYFTNSVSMSHSIQSGQPSGGEYIYEHDPCPFNSAKFAVSSTSEGVGACGLSNSLVKRTSTWDTKDEELLLKLFLMYFGNDWAQYRQFFPTRTIDSIKSKFHNLVRATNRKRSKIHGKSHQNIVIMIKRAQELMKDDVKRSQHDPKQKAYNLTPFHAANKYTAIETMLEEPQPRSSLPAPLKSLSPAKVQLNDLSKCPFQLPCPLPSSTHSLPRQNERCNPSPLLPSSHSYTMHQNIPQFRSPVDWSAVSKDSSVESSGIPLLYVEKGRLFSHPVDYFGAITLPFSFSKLGEPILSVVHPSHQHFEELMSPEASSTAVGPIKLEEGSYLNAVCTKCGSAQTLRVKRVEDILVFNSIHGEDAGSFSVPNTLNSIQTTVCTCLVCTTSAELVKEADKYVWKLRYPASHQASSESPASTPIGSAQVTDQHSSAICQCSTPGMQTPCDDEPPFYQNFELDSIDCFSTSARSSNAYVGISTPMGGLDSCANSHIDNTWTSASLSTERLSFSTSSRLLESTLPMGHPYSIHNDGQPEAGPLSTDNLSFSIPLQYQDDLLCNTDINL